MTLGAAFESDLSLPDRSKDFIVLVQGGGTGFCMKVIIYMRYEEMPKFPRNAGM